MRCLLFISFLACFISGCKNNAIEKKVTMAEKSIQPDSSDENSVDTSFVLFNNNAYRLLYHFRHWMTDWDTSKNANIYILVTENGSTKKIFIDSVSSSNSILEFTDFNNDGIKDVLIYYCSGARANEHYWLYTSDTINHTLNKVAGFEDLPNATFDTANNVIETMALYGTVGYSFYRINKKNQLIDLGEFYEEDINEESKKYEKAIRNIRRKYGY